MKWQDRHPGTSPSPDDQARTYRTGGSSCGQQVEVLLFSSVSLADSFRILIGERVAYASSHMHRGTFGLFQRTVGTGARLRLLQNARSERRKHTTLVGGRLITELALHN